MPAWGTAIFSDKLAAEIKREYNLLLSTGMDEYEAEARMIAFYPERIPEAKKSVFWLALSLAQWSKGRLSDNVKEKALECIESGEELKRWRLAGNEARYIKRKRVLEELENTLKAAQPERRTPRKPSLRRCPWREGELLLYHIINNSDIEFSKYEAAFAKYALLRVEKIGREPVSKLLPEELYDETLIVSAYDRCFEQAPGEKDLEGLKTAVLTLEDGQATERIRLGWLGEDCLQTDITLLPLKPPECAKILSEPEAPVALSFYKFDMLLAKALHSAE